MTPCKDCPPGTKADADNEKCLYDETGCEEGKVPDKRKKCRKCRKGQIADPLGKTCVDQNKQNGKCPQGKILDPRQGSQDARTEKPVCIDDDDSKCEAPQKAATRPKKTQDGPDVKPQCGVDEKSDHRCDDTRTYDHKEAKGGKISHSCRSTKDTDDRKKEKYDKRVKEVKGDIDKKDKRDQKRRGRMGFCFTLLAAFEAWNMADIQKMSGDEFDGMINMWPDQPNLPDPDKDIADYMVRIYKEPVSYVIIPDIAQAGGGLGAAIRALIGVIKGALSGAKNLGPSAIKAIRTGNRPASAGAKNAAKQSSTVGRIVKDQRFLECLAATAGIAATAALPEVPQKNVPDMAIGITHISIDWNRVDDGSIKAVPEQYLDRTLTVALGLDTDETKYVRQWTTFPHEFRGLHWRLKYETCMATKDYSTGWSNRDEDFDNSVTDIEVWGGCCSFYDGQLCEPGSFMFSAQDREDGQLDGPHNDAISSMWCTFEPNCKGAPGV
ncbi:hypothetical protein B0J11DRAFT_574581 [Dendryphion nanum]|uniref:Uncharacterized protein n=1 Tax=Dendryphion nanum TaxID=256645 RepID=A0A9P9J251_9PLEO|nr:hypothetical protein B0J11DRAFT_574581 [Dendryphion nanum]